MTEYILPLVYTSDNSYLFKIDAFPFVKVSDIDLIEQKKDKLPEAWQDVAKMLVNNARKFPIIEKNVNERNYSLPSVYERWYCTVQNVPEGNYKMQPVKRTPYEFLTQPQYWNFDLVRQMCLHEQTIQQINQLLGVYVNLTCLKNTQRLDDDIECGDLIVQVITPLDMSKGEAFAIYNINTGGYFKKTDEGPQTSEPLFGATLFPSLASAQYALEKMVDFGSFYTIVPVSMQAQPHLEIVNRGARGNLTEQQKSLLAELNRQVLVNQAGIAEKLEKKSSAKAKKM